METVSATVPTVTVHRQPCFRSDGAAAWLRSRLTSATLRKLAELFGLSHPRRLARPFCHTDILEFIKLDFGVFQ
jgi:hypothetical protein